MKDIATNWFHEKWSVPTEAYLECIEDYLFSGKLGKGCSVRCTDGQDNGMLWTIPDNVHNLAKIRTIPIE